MKIFRITKKVAMAAVLFFLASCGGGGAGSQGVNSKGSNGDGASIQTVGSAATDPAKSPATGLQPATGATIEAVPAQSSALAITTSAAGPGLSGHGTATIDGVMSPGEWDKAATIDFEANVPSHDGGGTTPAALYIMNDGTNLYAAVKIVRVSFGGAVSAFFEFDNDNDCVREDGDDVFGLSVGAYMPSVFFDDCRYTCPGAAPGSAGCAPGDTELLEGFPAPGTSDGSGAATNDGTYTIIELSHPLDSGDKLHDFSLAPGDQVGFIASVRLFSLDTACNFGHACYADTNFPESGTYCADPAGRILIASSTSQTLNINLDIAPGDPISGINPANKGMVPVAVLSTVDFDAPAMVDAASLTFGRTGDEQSLVFCNKGGEDVNGDGLLDLVCHFTTRLTGFLIGDTTGYLKGKTVAGASFTGSDQVRIVPE